MKPVDLPETVFLGHEQFPKAPHLRVGLHPSAVAVCRYFQGIARFATTAALDELPFVGLAIDNAMNAGPIPEIYSARCGGTNCEHRADRNWRRCKLDHVH